MDDATSLVFRTRDGGRSWTRITRGLADDASVNVVRGRDPRPRVLDPRQDHAVAGTGRHLKGCPCT
jgi:hypothetical protein